MFQLMRDAACGAECHRQQVFIQWGVDRQMAAFEWVVGGNGVYKNFAVKICAINPSPKLLPFPHSKTLKLRTADWHLAERRQDETVAHYAQRWYRCINNGLTHSSWSRKWMRLAPAFSETKGVLRDFFIWLQRHCCRVKTTPCSPRSRCSHSQDNCLSSLNLMSAILTIGQSVRQDGAC